MTRTRYRIDETQYPYFLTCTIVGWLPVFTRPEAVEVVLDSWRFLQQNQNMALFGYVILENHLHWIAAAPRLPAALKSFKMFTARRLIDLLQIHGAEVILGQLRALKLPHKTRSQYQFWQEGSHPKQIGNNAVMRQKLDYLHNNPVKRGYVDDPLHWRYSSARNYAGQAGLIEVVTDWG
jgi:REP element-mobilizing transposase RayT